MSCFQANGQRNIPGFSSSPANAMRTPERYGEAFFERKLSMI
jgi:hypothetical protein